MTARKPRKKPAAKATPKRTAKKPAKRGKARATASFKAAFLDAYRTQGNIRQAAETAGIGRQTHYDWIAADPDYRAAFEHATEDAGDLLERVAWHRATVGWQDKPPSDTLLIFLLKGLRPAKYRERYDVQADVAHSGAVSVVYVAEGADGRRIPLADALGEYNGRRSGVHLTERDGP